MQYVTILPMGFDDVRGQERQALAEIAEHGSLHSLPVSEVFVDEDREETKRKVRIKARERWAERVAEGIKKAAKRAAEEERVREVGRKAYHEQQERLRKERYARGATPVLFDELKGGDVTIEAPKKRPRGLPVFCGDEPTEAPIFRKGDYRTEEVEKGDEFTVLWPGHPINRRVFVAKDRCEKMFASGDVKDCVVFDFDGREMRIETRACWSTYVFNILGEKP